VPTRRGNIIAALVESAQKPTLLTEDEPKIPYHRRLRVKLLLLICICVLFTEALVFLPSIANRQLRWFENQHRFGYALSLSVYKTDEYGLEERTLTNFELVGMAITFPDGTIEEILTDQPKITIDRIIDLDRMNGVDYLISAMRTLFIGGNRIIQIIGQVGDDGTKLSLLTRDHSLREALFQFSNWFFFSSLTIALIVAAAIYLFVTEILVRPLYRIYSNVLDFVMAPDDPQAILVPARRHDEIGLVERRLAAIETELQYGYAQQKHLAELGLAISKINHDMRNLLASAHLISDRLSSIDDPLIQRLAPKLIRTIDRAINYSHSVLLYGKIQEQPPHLQRLSLKPLIDDVIDVLEPDQYGNITIDNKVGENFEIDADGEQIHRIFTNLCRNAVQALMAQKSPESGQDPPLPKKITFEAHNEGEEAVIWISDNGPGLPERAREHLFKPFRGSGRANGTGLGLAICHELVRAHGGTIRLMEEQTNGTCFEIRLPDHPPAS